MGIYSMLTQLGPLLGPFLGKEKKSSYFFLFLKYIRRWTDKSDVGLEVMR